MKYSIVILVGIFLMSCSATQKQKEHLNDWSLFSQLEIGKDTQESVRAKLGDPTEIDSEYLKPNEVQWNYLRREVPKIGVFFIDGILQYSSMDVWEGEDIQILSYLLDKLPGKWKVEQEKPVSAHFMPFLCYLIDEKNGKKIEIHGYKKVVESIYRWDSKLPPKKVKSAKTYPDVDPNRCDWLKDFLKSKGLLAN